MNENNEANDRITFEIARKLASEGNYNEAINLLSPLIHSQFSIEALNLLGKIYAQMQDFESAQIYFNQALEQDANNAEAKMGLDKCLELKDSKLKTYFSFNKLKVYSIIAALIVIVGIIAVVSVGLSSTATSSQFEGTAMANADLITLSINVNGNAQALMDSLGYIDSNVANLEINSSGGSVNVTGDVSAIYNVLYELDGYDAYVDTITLSLSKEAADKAVLQAYDAALSNAKSNMTSGGQVKNITSSVVPNSFYIGNSGNFTTQKQTIFNQLNENNMKVRAISVIEVKS